MLFWTIVKVALRSLFANKLRSFLAVLGIIIGVAAVIAMLALGAGAKQQVLDRITSMGTNLLIVRPTQRGTGGVMSGTQQNLTIEDAQALLREVPGIHRIAPVVMGNAQVKRLGKNTRTQVVGTTVTYPGIRAFEIERGRNFSDMQVDRPARVAVLGPTTVENLFGADDPLDENVKLNGVNYRVIGVTKAKGDQGWFDPDDQVMIPLTTAMKQVFGLTYLREIDIEATDSAKQAEVQDAVTALLRKRHKTPADADSDFQIRNQAQLLEDATSMTRTFTILLGGIASISLLVGGIGIMNIMLVTVTERTREIGVRKAIGAKERDILLQFLIEAVLMSGLGGLVGVAGGIGGAQLVGKWTDFQTLVELPSILMALSFAAGVGIFFGYYPASRAAKLDPIEALRYE